MTLSCGFGSSVSTSETFSKNAFLGGMIAIQPAARLPRSNAKKARPSSRAQRTFSILKRTRAESGQYAGTFAESGDRKSTRLNSSHSSISYAVFCLKKKKKIKKKKHTTETQTNHENREIV